MFSADWNNAAPDDSQVIALAAAEIRNIKRDFRERINSFMPIGAITEWPTDTAPDGWKECDGASLAVASYYDLFLVLGYRYGGSGANFNIPDMRGLFVRCLPHGELWNDLDCHTMISTTGTTVAGSPIITGIPSTANLKVGMYVSSNDCSILYPTTIQSVDSPTQVTLTINAGVNKTQGAILFYAINVYCSGDISGTAITNVAGLIGCPRLGAEINGTGIPAGTVILAFPSFNGEGIPTAITLSQSASAGTAVEITINNDVIGSLGYDANKPHSHAKKINNEIQFSVGGFYPAANVPSAKSSTGNAGGAEFRPINNYSMYIIRTDPI